MPVSDGKTGVEAWWRGVDGINVNVLSDMVKWIHMKMLA